MPSDSLQLATRGASEGYNRSSQWTSCMKNVQASDLLPSLRERQAPGVEQRHMPQQMAVEKRVYDRAHI